MQPLESPFINCTGSWPSCILRTHEIETYLPRVTISEARKSVHAALEKRPACSEYNSYPHSIRGT